MKDNIKTYPLRPHHGMCLAFFIGEGYSEEFTKNMRCMRQSLENGAKVRLEAGCDVICKACPNRAESDAAAGSGKKASQCVSEEKVMQYDRAVLKACSLKEGEEISFSEFAALVQEKIIAPGRRKEICAGCRWSCICGNVKSRWDKKSRRAKLSKAAE